MTTEVTIHCESDRPERVGLRIPKQLAELLDINDGDRLSYDWYMQTLAALRGYNLGRSVQFREGLKRF